MQQNSKTSISTFRVKEKLIQDSKGRNFWLKHDLVDWFLSNFPICSNLTVKELISIATCAGLRVL